MTRILRYLLLLIQALQNPPDKRVLKHLLIIERCLDQFNYFQKMKHHNYKKQLNMSYKTIGFRKLVKGQTVFFKGDWPTEFFIIIRGQVYILIPKSPDQINRHREKNKQSCRTIDQKIISFVNRSQLIKGFETMARKDKKMSMLNTFSWQQMQTFFDQVVQDQKAKDTKKAKDPKKAKQDDISDSSSSESESDEENFEQLLDQKRATLFFNISKAHRFSVLQMNKKLSLAKPQINYLELHNVDLLNFPIAELDNVLTIGDLDYPEKYYEQGVFKYQAINVLVHDDTFGDSGLLYMQGRSATVLCTADCHFGIFSKQYYDQIFYEIEQMKMEKKAQFIQNAFQVFVPHDLKFQMVNCFHKAKLSKGSFLFSEDEKANEVFVIKKGEAQIFKLKCQRPNNENDDKVMVVRNQPKSSKVKLTILSSGMMVGHQDILFKRKRLFTVEVISSEATVFVTDKYQYKLQLNELQFSKSQIYRIAKNFDTQMQENYEAFIKTQNQSLQLNVPASQKPAIRACVKDIEVYGQRPIVEVLKGKIRKREFKAANNYGPNATEKMIKIAELANQQQKDEPQSNDQFLEVFDRVALERRARKIQIWKKYKTSAANQDEYKAAIQKINQGVSTREKIQKMKEIESGEFKKKINQELRRAIHYKPTETTISQKLQEINSEASLLNVNNNYISINDSQNVQLINEEMVKKHFEEKKIQPYLRLKNMTANTISTDSLRIATEYNEEKKSEQTKRINSVNHFFKRAITAVERRKGHFKNKTSIFDYINKTTNRSPSVSVSQKTNQNLLRIALMEAKLKKNTSSSSFTRRSAVNNYLK